MRVCFDVLDHLKPLNDDLRVHMCKACKSLEDERQKLFNKNDIYCQEKKHENARLNAVSSGIELKA